MSLPRFVAGPITFGLNAGLAVVAWMVLDGDVSALPWLARIAWAAGLVLAAVTLKLSWPIMHTSAAGALLLTTVAAAGTEVWALPLAGAVAALGMARFASVGLASRWLSRTVGLAALAVLALAGWSHVQGGLTLGGQEAGGIQLLAGVLALVVLAVLGLWHPSGEEES